MKKQALDALKAKYTGVSEAILGRIADKIIKTAKTTEDVTTAVEGVTFQQVLESYGDSRATEAQQTAVTNYEKKHGLKDGKKIETEEGTIVSEGEKEGTVKHEDLATQIATIVAAEVKSLKDDIAAMRGEKVATTRKTALNKVLEGAPEKIRQRYEKDFARMTFNDEEDFNAWIGEITPDVEAITNDFKTKGGVVTRPRGGASGGEGDNENPYLKARIAEREAETATTAIVGLPTVNK